MGRSGNEFRITLSPHDILAVQQLKIFKEQGGHAQMDAGQSRPLKQFLRQPLGASQVTRTIRARGRHRHHDETFQSRHARG
jgi:hypothetical protein